MNTIRFWLFALLYCSASPWAQGQSIDSLSFLVAVGSMELKNGITLMNDDQFVADATTMTYAVNQDLTIINRNLVRSGATYIWRLNTSTHQWIRYGLKDAVKADTYTAVNLSNDDIALVDSLGATFDWDAKGFKLLGYDSLLQKKLFSVRITSPQSFEVCQYVPNLKLPDIFVPNYSGPFINIFYVLDLNRQRTYLIDSMKIGGKGGDLAIGVPYGKKEEVVFNFRFRQVRPEGNGKLSIMKIYEDKKHPKSYQHIQVFEHNYRKGTKKCVLDAPMYDYQSDYYAHRIYKGRVLVSDKYSIMEYRNNQWHVLYSVPSKTDYIIDFFPLGKKGKD